MEDSTPIHHNKLLTQWRVIFFNIRLKWPPKLEFHRILVEKAKNLFSQSLEAEEGAQNGAINLTSMGPSNYESAPHSHSKHAMLNVSAN
jgi:hypothetical protein